MTEEEYAKKKELEALMGRVVVVETDQKLMKKDIDVLKDEIKILPSIDKRLALQQQTLNGLSKNINKLIWVVLTALIAAGANLLFEYLKG